MRKGGNPALITSAMTDQSALLAARVLAFTLERLQHVQKLAEFRAQRRLAFGGWRLLRVLNWHGGRTPSLRLLIIMALLHFTVPESGRAYGNQMRRCAGFNRAFS
jgi:hypothetical protein